eukprot:3181241-Heterocapsa_arctica.AAC.1
MPVRSTTSTRSPTTTYAVFVSRDATCSPSLARRRSQPQPRSLAAFGALPTPRPIASAKKYLLLFSPTRS